MSNNPSLFNAAIAGASGGGQERYITDSVAINYATFRDACIAFATSVDAAIPTIVSPGATQADNDLLQSLCQGVMSNRYPTSSDSADWDIVAGAVAALFTEL